MEFDKEIAEKVAKALVGDLSTVDLREYDYVPQMLQHDNLKFTLESAVLLYSTSKLNCTYRCWSR